MITKTDIRDENNRIKPEAERLMVEMIKELVKEGKKEETEILDYMAEYFEDKFGGDMSLGMFISDLCLEHFKCEIYYSLR